MLTERFEGYSLSEMAIRGTNVSGNMNIELHLRHDEQRSPRPNSWSSVSGVLRRVECSRVKVCPTKGSESRDREVPMYPKGSERPVCSGPCANEAASKRRNLNTGQLRYQPRYQMEKIRQFRIRAVQLTTRVRGRQRTYPSPMRLSPSQAI